MQLQSYSLQLVVEGISQSLLFSHEFCRSKEVSIKKYFLVLQVPMFFLLQIQTHVH